MPLESLLELVETLRSRIKNHGDALRKNEHLTRYALIDPLLRELGWDTSDPAAVVPEYKSGSGSADYALLSNGSPAMMVEAKKLGTPLQDSVVSQGINYCLMEGTKHFAVTDGARWDIYETHKPVPIDQKRVAEFDLINQSPAESCLRAMALWRPSVQAGYVAPGNSPVISYTEQTKPTPPVVVAPSPLNEEWHPLTSIDASIKPVEMMFPDGSRGQVKYWSNLPQEPASWLNSKGLLSPSHCPIRRSSQSIRYIVHTEPIHSNGNEFTSKKAVGNDLYLEAHNNANDQIKDTIAIITHVGQDPAQFKVRFD